MVACLDADVIHLGVAGRAVIAVTVVVLLPGLVITTLGFGNLSSASALAAIAAAVPAMRVSPRMGLVVSGVLALASALAVPAASNALAAGLLMAVVAGVTGVAAHYGTSAAVVMAPISVTFLLVERPATESGALAGALIVGAVVLASSLWAVGVVALLGRGGDRPRLQEHSWSRSTLYAVTLAVTVGVSTAFVLERGLGHSGGWFVMTLLIVLQPYVQDAVRKTLERGVGTALGFLIAIGAIAVLPNETLRYIAGGLFAVLASIALLVQHRPYWQYVMVLTPSVVLLEGAATDTMETAWQRLTFTLLGVITAGVVEVALYPVYRRWAARAGTDHF